jgi:hypothetical protein
MAHTITLPNEIAEQATILATNLGLSLEELSVMALQELLEKYRQNSDADWDFKRKMTIAKRGIHKYHNALIELAK